MTRMSTAGPSFTDRIRDVRAEPLIATDVGVLQVNLGYRCNMSCKHCHVEGRPEREQMMDGATVRSVLAVLEETRMGVLDITGGAPELNPHFRYLVKTAAKTACRTVVRTNLTVYFVDGMEDLPEFLCDHGAEIIASLPYYTEHDVDRVRGKGAFEKSVSALRRLNRLGYGLGSGQKKLNLVYNPAGAFLSPDQKVLGDDYRRELGRRFGISFDALYTFNNMPIGRFRDYLMRTGSYGKYMEKLVCAFNPETVSGLMCRYLVNVGWDGRLYDCDFNQLLGLGVQDDCPQHISEFDLSRLSRRAITVGDHCYACTAGQGST
jgi:radical SAM/Cys-rich protein